MYVGTCNVLFYYFYDPLGALHVCGRWNGRWWNGHVGLIINNILLIGIYDFFFILYFRITCTQQLCLFSPLGIGYGRKIKKNNKCLFRHSATMTKNNRTICRFAHEHMRLQIKHNNVTIQTIFIFFSKCTHLYHVMFTSHRFYKLNVTQ